MASAQEVSKDPRREWGLIQALCDQNKVLLSEQLELLSPSSRSPRKERAALVTGAVALPCRPETSACRAQESLQ